MKSQTQSVSVQKKVTMSQRGLYGYFSVPFNRTMMLEKIENGLKHKIDGIKDFDKEEDMLSKYVLTNWKNLKREERYKYCRIILNNSIDGQSWAWQHKDKAMEFIKGKVKFWKKPNKSSEEIKTIKNEI